MFAHENVWSGRILLLLGVRSRKPPKSSTRPFLLDAIGGRGEGGRMTDRQNKVTRTYKRSGSFCRVSGGRGDSFEGKASVVIAFLAKNASRGNSWRRQDFGIMTLLKWTCIGAFEGGALRKGLVFERFLLWRQLRPKQQWWQAQQKTQHGAWCKTMNDAVAAKATLR